MTEMANSRYCFDPGTRLADAVHAPAAERVANQFDLQGGRVMIRSGSQGRAKNIEIRLIEIRGQAESLLTRVKEHPHS